MITKRRIVTVLALVALTALASLGVFRGTQRAHAQDTIPPPIPDRISFGMVGITSGQTLRISVAHTVMPNDTNYPPGPYRVVLNFRTSNGQLVRDRRGEVIRRVVDLERGDSTFLDLNFDEQPPPIPDRMQLRAVVTLTPPPQPEGNTPPPTGDRTATTLEVINNANGRTAFAISTPPAVQKVQPPPQPE